MASSKQKVQGEVSEDTPKERFHLEVKHNGQTFRIPASELLVCRIPKRKDREGREIPTHKAVSIQGVDGRYYDFPNGSFTSKKWFPKAEFYSNPRWLVPYRGPKPTGGAYVIIQGVSART